MAKLNPWLNEKIKIPGIYDQLIIIDNKEINQLIERGRKTTIGAVSTRVESELAKKLGFKGQGTDVSSKADFQQFSLVVKEEALKTPESIKNPTARRFIESLKETAMGETYGDPSKVVKERGRITGEDPEGTYVGGLGAELKLKKEVFDVEKLLSGKGSFDGVTITQVSPSAEKSVGYEAADIIAAKEEFIRGGGTAGQFFEKLLSDNQLASKLFVNPGILSKTYKKTKNVFTLVSFKFGNKVVNTLYYIQGLVPAPGDITGALDYSPGKRNRIQWKYSSAFEKRVVTRALQLLGEDIGKGLTDVATQNALGILSLEKDLNGLQAVSTLNTVASIPLPYVANITVPESKTTSRKKKPNQNAMGRLISSAQLTAILQNRIENRMPKLGPPNPTQGLKYRTGRFVNALQFTIDYRNQLISYYAQPPVSEYFDKFHSRPYAVGQRLIRPTIRKTVQELFGRQFRIIKT